jgi:hypothetical protein
MIKDAQLIFEESQAMPNDDSIDAANTLDLQADGVGGGGNLYFNAMVTVAPTAGTSIQVDLLGSPDDDVYVDIVTSDEVEQADATKGKVIISVSLPPDVSRYLKVNLVGNGDMSDGKVSTWLSREPVKSL